MHSGETYGTVKTTLRKRMEQFYCNEASLSSLKGSSHNAPFTHSPGKLLSCVFLLNAFKLVGTLNIQTLHKWATSLNHGHFLLRWMVKHFFFWSSNSRYFLSFSDWLVMVENKIQRCPPTVKWLIWMVQSVLLWKVLWLGKCFIALKYPE